MAPAEPAGQPRPEELLEILAAQMRDLKTTELAETVLRSVSSLNEMSPGFSKQINPCLNAIRCFPAFRELDTMDAADLVRLHTAKSMLLGLTPVNTFFCMLPSPERHNECGDYDKLAELYRSPAQVLAVRSRLDRDPFKSFDPDDFSIVEVVIKFTDRFGTWNPHGTVPMGYEGVKELEACLVRLALRHTSNKAKHWHKERYYSYLRWVVQGRKTSASPFAGKSTNSDGTTLQSSVEENLSTLSNGIISGPCASCGSHDATHLCKLCLINFDNQGSEHTVSATTYCNQHCQNAHVETHKAKCKEMRNLARSSALCKEAFYQYIQAPNGLPPVFGVTFEQGIVTKHRLPTSSKVRSLRYPPESQWQADAVMTSFTCADIYLWARPLLEFLIRPCCASAMIISHSVKNAEVAVTNDGVQYNTLSPHITIRLTLPSGLEYAFDPSAAQFGWKEYLAPWDEYTHRRIHLIEQTAVLEPLGDTQVPNGAIEKRLGISPIRFQDKERAATELVNVIRARKGGRRAMLKLSDGQFEEAKKDLVKTMKDVIQRITKSSE